MYTNELQAAKEEARVAGYLRPTNLQDALSALAEAPRAVLAGGTDYYAARVGQPLDDDVLDISAIEGLRGVEARGDHWRIGALSTWTDILRADLPPLFDGLKLAAREVGGVQIQNAGTVCGNLCNASPAADGVPPLLSLAASVELSSMSETKTLPLADFLLGNRETARKPDQLMTAVLVPKPSEDRAYGHFLKLGARKYLVISIVMVAATVEIDADAKVTSAGVAVGSCSPVAQRLPALERALLGRACDGALGQAATPEQLTPLAPIDDVRGSSGYRADAALTLVRRTLNELGAMA